jgi:hypothetical protein
MNYKPPVTLSSLIAWGFIHSDAEYLSNVNGHELPERFQATFFIEDKGHAFQLQLWINIENEKPHLHQVRVFGTGGTSLSFLKELESRRGDSEPWREVTKEEIEDLTHLPVQARHLTLVAKFHYELLQKAVALAIESEAKKRDRPYSSAEIDQIQKELAKYLKRNVPTDSMLKDVAKRYKKAEKAGDPLYEDIMRHYSISERRARELITMCRRHKEKLLPKKKAGRPSVDQTPTKKKGKK